MKSTYRLFALLACVLPACGDDDMPSSECSAADDCAEPMCGAVACTDGMCTYSGQDGCEADQRCMPMAGCVDDSTDMDAGPDDAGRVDAATCVAGEECTPDRDLMSCERAVTECDTDGRARCVIEIIGADENFICRIGAARNCDVPEVCAGEATCPANVFAPEGADCPQGVCLAGGTCAECAQASDCEDSSPCTDDVCSAQNICEHQDNGSCTGELVSLAVGNSFNCTVNDYGRAYCWGNNGNGQIGIGSNRNPIAEPTPLMRFDDFVSIRAGASRACGIRRAGELVCWGVRFTSAPEATGDFDSVSRVTVGGPIIAQLPDRSLHCWGNNNQGQCGLGHMENFVSDPTEITSITDAMVVRSADDHSCAIRDNGELLCWGNNFDDALPFLGGVPVLTPTVVTELTNVIDVDLAQGHGCAVVQDGTTICWGRNNLGQLGDGSDASRVTPAAASGVSNAVRVAVGGSNSCVIRNDGALFCTGANGNDELAGAMAPAIQRTFVQLPAFSNVTEIGVGEAHFCAMEGTTQVRCWGGNTLGQAGTGATSATAAPTLVAGLNQP